MRRSDLRGLAGDDDSRNGEVEPTYSGCSSLSGFASATIDTNGCKYKFNITSETTTTTFDGDIAIVCPAGSEITVTASLFGQSKCIIHIPPQTNLANVEYHNVGSGNTRDVTVTVSLTGITYTQTAGSGFGACTTEHQTNGTYTGEATVKGFEGKKQKGIWIA